MGLAIKKELASRVYAINKLDGRALMADLHLKNKINVRIIIIYMPANQEDKIERCKINKTILDWINKGQYDKKHIIIMGDLNVNIDNYTTNTNTSNIKSDNKFYILKILLDAGLLEVQSASHNTPTYTWLTKRNDTTVKSRIDYIWLSSSLFQQIKKVHVTFDDNFDTDHGLLHTALDCTNLIISQSNSQSKRSTFTRSVFAYDKMTKEDWENYQLFISNKIKEDKIIENFIQQPNRSGSWINNLWEQIANIFMLAKTHAGKTKKITRQDKHQLYTKIQNKKYSAMKLCIEWRRNLKKSNQHYYNIPVEEVKKLENICHEYKIPTDKSINQKTFSSNLNFNIKDITSRLNFIIKQIRITIDAEETIEKIEQMKEAINNRCKNFKEDKYSMLNSLLYREKKSIIIDHLVIKDEQGMDIKITDENLIKQKVKENFENITNYKINVRNDLEED